MSDAYGQQDQPAPAWPPAAGATAPAAPEYPTYPANPAYPQPGAYGPGVPASPFLGEKPKNPAATWALVAGAAVVVILAVFQFAIASALAILLSVRGIRRANEIKRTGYPQAVGMTRALIGLALSVIGLVVYVQSF